MKFEHTKTFNWEGAIRGMRNPLESWNKIDTLFTTDGSVYNQLGKNDLDLMQRLIKAGSCHRKFMRQIFVSVDITAALYWWKEFETYKVGTVANSTSTMHKLAATPITENCFEMDDFNVLSKFTFDILDKNISYPIYFDYVLIPTLEKLRQKYNETKDNKYWKELIRILPESWLQTRTITMSYENILNMIQYRSGHKLNEWSNSFISWCHSLPFAEDLLFIQK